MILKFVNIANTKISVEEVEISNSTQEIRYEIQDKVLYLGNLEFKKTLLF